jgi:hypothetical protein
LLKREAAKREAAMRTQNAEAIMSLAEWNAIRVARHAHEMELMVKARQGTANKLRIDRARAAARAAAIEAAHLMIPGVAYGVRPPVAMTTHKSVEEALKEPGTASRQGVAEGSSERLDELGRLRVALRTKALAWGAEKQRAREAAVAEVERRFLEWRDWARGGKLLGRECGS